MKSEGTRLGTKVAKRRWDKEITLLAIVILVLAVFSLLPRNTRWVADRLLPYWNDLTSRHRATTQERRAARYGAAYTLSQQLAILVPHKDSTLVLVPPKAYFKQYGLDYHVPEPAIFYYYTGLKTTWANSPMALKANAIAAYAGGRFVILPVASIQQLNDSIQAYKKWGYEL